MTDCHYDVSSVRSWFSPVRDSYFEFDVAFTRCTLLIRLCGWRCGVVAFVDARVVASIWTSAVVASFYSRTIASGLFVVSVCVSCIR